MRLVLGVDPSLTATGLALVEFRELRDVAPIFVTLQTIRPKGKTFLDRLVSLRAKLAEFRMEIPVPQEIAVEDATDFRRARHRSAQSSARLGAAVGVVLVELHAWGVPVAVYGTQEWLPKARVYNRTGGGGWMAPVKHEQVVAYYRGFPGLGEGTDDEVMGAALAMFHVQKTGNVSRETVKEVSGYLAKP